MDREFKVIFTADTTQVIAGIHQLGAEFKAFESYVNGTGSGMQSLHKNVADLTSRVNVASDSMQRMGGATRSTTTDIIAMGAGMLAIQGSVAVVAALGDIANKTRERISEMAIETMNLRDKLRELANLKGADGPDNIIAAETVQMGMKAGMLPDEMRRYLEQYEGSSPTGEEKKHIDEKTKQELALEGAKFGVRVKLAPNTAGDLAGVISQYTDLTKDEKGQAIPQEQRTERAMTQMGRVAYGLNKGRGNLEPLVRSLINTAGAVVSMGGPIEDLGDLAAIQGVASTHANPRESGTRVRQAVRALRDTKGDAGRFLTKTAKIEDGDNHITRLEKVKTQVDIAKKNGKQADIFLRQMGFSDEDEMRSVLEQVEDLDSIKQRVAEGKKNSSGREVMKADDRFLDEQRAGVRRKQMAAKAGQEFLIGEKNERFEMAKETAEQQLKEEHKLGGWWNGARDLASDLGGVRTNYLGYESSREVRKAKRAEDNLVKEAERVGIPKEQIYGMLSGGKAKTREGYDPQDSMSVYKGMYGMTNIRESRSEGERVKRFEDLATEVERKKGSPFGQSPNLDPKFNELITEQKTTNKLLQQIANQPPGQAGPQPGIPPMRGAAAPKRGI